MTTKLEILDAQPLEWPEGWSRTRLQDRERKTAWKKNYADSVTILAKELSLLGATAAKISRNEHHNEDAGVALYLSLKPIDQYGWQEALGFVGLVPSLTQIDRAYMDKVKLLPRLGVEPDPALFMELTKHRDRARAWAKGEQTVETDKVIACDVFKEQRWNVIAIRGTLHCMRMMELYGATGMTERAWRGFNKALLAQGSGTETGA